MTAMKTDKLTADVFPLFYLSDKNIKQIVVYVRSYHNGALLINIMLQNSRKHEQSREVLLFCFPVKVFISYFFKN